MNCKSLINGVTDGARTRDNQNHNLSQTSEENSSLPDSFGILATGRTRKNQTLAKSARAIFGTILLSLSPILAQAEAFIQFEAIQAGAKTFTSVAVNAEEGFMFSRLSGGVFYKEDNEPRVLPISEGGCQQASGDFMCTFGTGDYTFRMIIHGKSGDGLVWMLGVEEPGHEKSYKAFLSELGPRLMAR